MAYLWVLGEHGPVKVIVTLGLDDHSYTEIIRGELRSDDVIILSEERCPPSPAR